MFDQLSKVCSFIIGLLVFVVMFPSVSYSEEIIFAGDVTLTANISPNQTHFLTSKAQNYIEQADLFLWNCEMSGLSKRKKNNRFVFSCNSDIIKNFNLKNGIALVANNHSFDGNTEGFKNLIDSLERHEISYVGMKNPDPKMNAKFYYNNDQTGGYYVINFSPMSRSSDSVYNTTSWEEVLETIKEINQHKWRSEYIIVNIHDGIEGTTRVSSRQKGYVHRLAKLGVDIISFTHSHTYIDPSMEKKTLVLWGVGNFIFGGNSGWRNRSDVRLMSVNPKTKEWKWIRGRTNDYVFDLIN